MAQNLTTSAFPSLCPRLAMFNGHPTSALATWVSVLKLLCHTASCLTSDSVMVDLATQAMLDQV
eukprot:4211956-Amphidinium_carterae.3